MSVLDKQIIFLAYSLANVVDTQYSTSELVVANNGSVIPKIVVFGASGCNSKSVV